jgi:hypothetical protein
VRVRLTRAAAQRLRRKGRLRVEILITLADVRGTSSTVRRTFTLRAPVTSGGTCARRRAALVSRSL